MEVPKPNKREVLIDVHAAGLNFFEWVVHDIPAGVAGKRLITASSKRKGSTKVGDPVPLP